MPTVEEILEAISRLSPSEQAEVARRLLERLARRRPAQATPDLVLLFDGGSMGNPGPGYGSFVLTWPGGKEVHRRVQFHRDLTNNEAEYATLIAALKEATPAWGRTPGGSPSKYAGTASWWPTRCRGSGRPATGACGSCGTGCRNCSPPSAPGATYGYPAARWWQGWGTRPAPT